MVEFKYSGSSLVGGNGYNFWRVLQVSGPDWLIFELHHGLTEGERASTDLIAWAGFANIKARSNPSRFMNKRLIISYTPTTRPSSWSSHGHYTFCHSDSKYGGIGFCLGILSWLCRPEKCNYQKRVALFNPFLADIDCLAVVVNNGPECKLLLRSSMKRNPKPSPWWPFNSNAIWKIRTIYLLDIIHFLKTPKPKPKPYWGENG